MKCKDETVQNCVSLLAAAVGQPEELLERWLELYYQVRKACEKEPRPPKAETPAAVPEKPGKNTALGHPGNHHAAGAAAYKRAVRERYLKAREAGLTTGRILEEAGEDLTDGNLLDIWEGRVVSIAIYRKLEAVLDKLEAEGGS